MAGNLVNHAHLAALAIEHAARISLFDADRPLTFGQQGPAVIIAEPSDRTGGTWANTW